MIEQFQTEMKKPGRGMAQTSRDLIAAMYTIAKAAQPITGCGVGYKAEGGDGRDQIVLYVGDLDPSGMFMSECNLPQQLVEYGGHHVKLRRIAPVPDQTAGQPFFPAADKRKDQRFSWFVERHGARCWEIDAMDPRDLRECTEPTIAELIEPTAWERCELVNATELEPLQTIPANWKGGVS